jgi:ferrous iron transport protein B
VTSCHGTSDSSGLPGVGSVATLSSVSVVLVGNPNVGKSTFFNLITGGHQKVTNAPGTTVELQVGTWRGLRPRGEDILTRVTDLPGTYSLLARSPDEHVVAEVISGTGPLGQPDLAVVLVEAGALSRSLYLVGQVADAGLGVVVGLTMNDVAQARGIHVDADHLSTLLGVPVVAIDPRTGAGAAELRQVVDAAIKESPRTVQLPPHVETAGADGDLDVAGAERLFTWVEQIQKDLDAGPGRASITDAASTPPHAPKQTRLTRSDRVDRVLLDPWFGIPVFLVVMWVLFQLATAVAAPLMDFVDGVINGTLADWLKDIIGGPAWIEGFLVDGLLAGVGTVLAFAPLMALMFLAIAVLEDSGYMARAAFVADKAMRLIGLDGRAMLPLVVGFGCNLPALAATKTLPNARQRLLTGLLIPYTSCPARLTVYILLATIFFPDRAGSMIFLMYVGSILLVVLGGLLMRKTLFRDLQREPLVLALPAYQRPRVRALLLSMAIRVWAFINKAGKIIIATLAIVWVLQAIPVQGDHSIADVPVEDSVYGWTAEAIAPVFAPAGFDDWRASAALVTGFVAKEVVVGSFAQSYAVDEPEDPAEADDLGARLQRTFDQTSGGHGAAAALAFMVFVLAYTPCLATVAEQKRLYGGRWTWGAVGVQLAIAWVLAVAVFQIGRLL